LRNFAILTEIGRIGRAAKTQVAEFSGNPASRTGFHFQIFLRQCIRGILQVLPAGLDSRQGGHPEIGDCTLEKTQQSAA
jgi:hypothetical protein